MRAENQVLREQLGGKRLKFSDKQRRLLGEKGRALGRKALRELATVAAPDTVLRWYRELVAKKCDGASQRGPGRPRKSAEVRELVARMARENRTWGYGRITGAMRVLGYELAWSTVKRILVEAGIPPAPERRKGMGWSEFLRAHWGAIAAADFFTVEVLTLRGLTRYLVFFVIDLKTRRVEIAGVAPAPHGPWMMQVARYLLDAEDGFLLGKTHIILDRDPLCTKPFRAFLKHAGVKSVRLPPTSPNLNSYAERFILSARNECLNRIVPLGEGHLRCTLAEYVKHYNLERTHRGLGNSLVVPHTTTPGDGPVVRHQRLGGVLSFYQRAA